QGWIRTTICAIRARHASIAPPESETRPLDRVPDQAASAGVAGSSARDRLTGRSRGSQPGSLVARLRADRPALLLDADAAVVELEAAGLSEVLLRRGVLEIAADLLAALDAQPGAGQRLHPCGGDLGVAAFAVTDFVGGRTQGELLPSEPWLGSAAFS